MEGYLVAEASHGVAALNLLEQVTPNGIIIDLNMPVMDGVTLIHELQTRGLRIPCIVATAAITASAMVGNIGVATIIAKPFEVDHLLAAVHEHCGPSQPTPAG